MSRGGRRRRWITRAGAPVWCAGGRWGPRRVRVTECVSVLRAEDLYTALLKENASAVSPGAAGTASYTVEGGKFTAGWEIRQNAVWRRGRAFLCCSRCAKRCTRLYLPLASLWLACRRCWGLTYQSRALQNYKDSLWGRGAIARIFGTSQREWAFQTTAENRTARLERSRERWAERRQLLR